MKEENIIIEEIVADEIYELDFISTTPKPFDKACVYGIFIRDRLVYIGYTYKGFQQRIESHEEAIKDKKKGDLISKDMYNALRECDGNYCFKVLYKCPEELNEYGLQLVEKSLIQLLEPKFNKEGVSKPYQFRCKGVPLSKLKR